MQAGGRGEEVKGGEVMRGEERDDGHMWGGVRVALLLTPGVLCDFPDGASVDRWQHRRTSRRGSRGRRRSRGDNHREALDLIAPEESTAQMR